MITSSELNQVGPSEVTMAAVSLAVQQEEPMLNALGDCLRICGVPIPESDQAAVADHSLALAL